jgi:hypothetical protein
MEPAQHEMLSRFACAVIAGVSRFYSGIYGCFRTSFGGNDAGTSISPSGDHDMIKFN